MAKNDLLQTTIKEIENTIFSDKKYQFRNCIQMSGWVIKKPTFAEYRGKPVAYFILFIIGKDHYDSYRCSTYNLDLVAQISQQKSVFAISCLGRCVNTRDNRLIFAVSDAKISYILENPFVVMEKGEEK